MDHKDLHRMCERLSYKYKNAQKREDLYQEGYMACLEVLGDKPNAHPAELHRAADKAMWDYVNFSGLPVSVPKNTASREARRDGKLELGRSYSEGGEEALVEAVGSVSVEYDDTSMCVPDCTEQYEKFETDAIVATNVITKLSGIELDVVKLRYYQGMTQAETGDKLGISKQAVSKHESSALSRLEKVLKQFVN